MLKRALSICQSQHQHHSGLCCSGLVAWVTGKTLLAGRGAPGRRCQVISQNQSLGDTRDLYIVRSDVWVSLPLAFQHGR